MRGKMLAALLMVILLAGPAMANGVVDQPKPIDFGIKGGVNLADLSWDPDQDIDWESFLRFGGGATLGFNVTPTVALDLDVLYMMKGTKAEGTLEQSGVSCDVEYQLRLDYLVFKPMLRFTPVKNGVSPYLLLGGEVGYLLNAETWAEASCSDGSSEENTEDFKDSVKDLDFGLNVGAGLEFPTGSTSFIIEGHYSLGLADINDAEEDDPDEPTVKTRGIYGFVGIRF